MSELPPKQGYTALYCHPEVEDVAFPLAAELMVTTVLIKDGKPPDPLDQSTVSNLDSFLIELRKDCEKKQIAAEGSEELEYIKRAETSVEAYVAKVKSGHLWEQPGYRSELNNIEDRKWERLREAVRQRRAKGPLTSSRVDK